VHTNTKSLKIVQNVLLASLALASTQATPFSLTKESAIHLSDPTQALLTREK